MGITTSHLDATTAPQVPVFDISGPVGGVVEEGSKDDSNNKPEQNKGKSSLSQLSCPVKYEEIQRETIASLKPELFEGLRFEFSKPLNQNFLLSHSILMGNMEVQNQGNQVIKIPNAQYEFGAHLLDQKFFLMGRILHDGRMSARAKYDITDDLGLKFQAQLMTESMYNQTMLDVDYRGSDFQSQLKFGNNGFYGANYIQSVTPVLALGAEIFWLASQRRSGVGIGGRWDSNKGHYATGQITTTGFVSSTYSHKISDKVNLATDLTYNYNNKDAVASVGYDYLFRHCRIRGRVDTNGCVAAYLEEKLNMGVSFILSAEIDHWKSDYKFGFGLTVGE